MRSTTTSTGLRLPVLAGSVTLAVAGVAQVAKAQVPSQVEPDDVVVVTGSHIPRDEFTSSAPIQVITPEAAEMAGLIDTGDIVQGASVASGSVQYNDRFQIFVHEGGQGLRPVSLRGLGAQRSLVLLNGRRAGPAGVRGQVSGFDLNVIPDSIVERYEILKDGASSIYGSDAIGGVVNIITRTSIESPEVSFDYTMPSESGGEAYSLSAATGFDIGSGNIMLAAQVQQREPIRFEDRDYLACQRDLVFDENGNSIDREDRSINAGTRYTQCRNLYANTVIDALTGVRYIEAPDGVTIGPLDGYRPRTNGSYGGGDPAYYEDQLFFPFANRQMAQNETTRSSVYLSSAFDVGLLGGIEWRNDILLNRRETSFERFRQFFPEVGTADIPALTGFGLPTDFFAYPNDPTWENGLGDTLALPVIPYPQNGSVEVDYTAFSTNLAGGFSGGSGWSWNLSATYSESTGDYRLNAVQSSRSGDINFDPDPPQFDYTSPEILQGDYGSAFLEAISANTLGRTSYEQYTISGLITGDVASVPAGDVSAAFGFEYRDNSIDDEPDALEQAGDLWGESTAQITEGQDHVSELFAEIELPLLADRSFAQELTLDASARVFDYKSYGSDSVWKAGINWQIIPILRIRGTEGTSFRAPALYELFLANQTSFLSQPAIDPCIDWGNSSNENIRANCAAAGIPSDFVGGASTALVVTGGGMGVLEAETSEATTFGVIITPEFANLSVAIDYFKIEVEDEVAQLGAGTILGGCYGAPVFPNEFCNLFTRDAGGNLASPDAFGIVDVNDSFLNVNNQITEGWDLTVSYERDFRPGTLLIEMQGTYTLEDVVNLFDPNLASGFETNDFNGSIGEPTFTSGTRFGFRRNDWTFNWFVDFINGMDNSAFDSVAFDYYGFADARRILTTPSIRYHDVSARWSGDDITVTVGVRNLTDEDPPMISDGQAYRTGNVPAYGTQYDLLGRSAFMSMTRQF